MGVVLGTLGAMAIAPLSDDVVLAERLAMVTPAIALIMEFLPLALRQETR